MYTKTKQKDTSKDQNFEESQENKMSEGKKISVFLKHEQFLARRQIVWFQFSDDV